MREEAIKILARYCVERYLERHRAPVGGAMYVDLHRGLHPEERTVCPRDRPEEGVDVLLPEKG